MLSRRHGRFAAGASAVAKSGVCGDRSQFRDAPHGHRQARAGEQVCRGGGRGGR